MNYFYDTEFLEGPQAGRNDDVMTIDLISIGIVSEDGREYYAIHSDFNLLLAWNTFQREKVCNKFVPGKPEGEDVFENIFWVRDNVLRKVYDDLCLLQKKEDSYRQYDFTMDEFTQDNLSWLLQEHGKSKWTIGKEILEFIQPEKETPVLYAYYSAYDHVVFCWIWGKMIDLPKGMPMYTRDLKQMLDEKASVSVGSHFIKFDFRRELQELEASQNLNDYLDCIKNHKDYPKNEDDHNALVDARWNKKLFDFLKSI